MATKAKTAADAAPQDVPTNPPAADVDTAAPAAKAKEKSRGAGPWVYIGPTDLKAQLKHKTAWLAIPAGANPALFVPLADFKG